MVDEARVDLRLRHDRLWGPVRWPEGTRACEIAVVEGWTLLEVIRSGALDPLAAVAIALDLCEAAAYVAQSELASVMSNDPSFTIVTNRGETLSETPGCSRLRFGVEIT
jgi:hypothetical protein